MNGRSIPLLAGLLCAACSSTLSAAPTRVATSAVAEPESVAEAGFLRQYAETGRFRRGRPFRIRLTADGSRVLFLRTGPRDRQAKLYVHDVAAGAERVLLSAEAIAGGARETLSAEELARRERTRSTARGIATYELARDDRHVLVPFSGRLYALDLKSEELREVSHEAGALDPQLSPDGEQVLFVRKGDLYVVDLLTGIERRLTRGASEHVTHGLAEFVAQEEMGRMHGAWWAPDGLSLLFQETDTTGVSKLRLTDPADPSARDRVVPYPRVGEANARVRLGWVGIDGGEPRWFEWDTERFPYLARVEWRSASAPPLVVVQSRSQREEAVLTLDLERAAVQELWVERDPEFLNIDPSTPRWLPDGSAFLWATEAAGAWQLELRTGDGALVHVLSDPLRGYAGVLSVDASRGEVWILDGEDPTQQSLARLPLDGKRAIARPHAGRGWASAQFAADHSTYVRVFSDEQGADLFAIHARDGRELGQLKSVAEGPGFEVNVQWEQARAPHDPHVALIRPRNFDQSSRYPVLFHAYGGPHVRTVRAVRNQFRLDQWLADHGYIVVAIDGRGTPGRGRAFERAITGEPAHVPLQDHVAALRALGEAHPELDLDRVGIFGWSYGGYLSAMGVLLHPEMFKAGVAGAPVTDWRHYDTHYTERYLGVPSGPQDPVYERASALTYAGGLTRPLLVVHGTADDNVWFVNSLQFVGATVSAPRAAQLLPLPGSTHMLRDPEQVEAVYARLLSHFRTHL